MMRSLILFAASAAANIFYAGVAESGGEFGVFGSKGQGLPGTFGVDYAFLNKSTLDIWVDHHKINLFRVAFLLERMCPLNVGLGNKFDETYFNHFNDAVTAITNKGAYAILDPHNYMRYNDPSNQPFSGSIIGDTSDPNAATTQDFHQFWNELAGRYKNNEKVIFGIMNEPHDMATSLVLKNDQTAIDAIRSAGAKQLILAPGNAFTAGHEWTTTNQADAPSSQFIFKLKDPAKNTAIDIHEYLDSGFAGTLTGCSQSYSANMDGLTQWLRKHGLKAMVTEFGGDNTPSCQHLVRGAVDYMASHDEYIGWTAWAAGPLWGTSSPCCNSGMDLGSLEPFSRAADGSLGLYHSVWLQFIQPALPKGLQRTGMSSVHGPSG